MSTTPQFSALMRKTRIAAGKSLGEVARHLGVSVTFVSDVERGVRAPFTKEKILALSSLFIIDPEPLLKAAATSRGFFALSADVTERKKALGASLMRRWPDLSPDKVERINRIVEEEEE